MERENRIGGLTTPPVAFVGDAQRASRVNPMYIPNARQQIQIDNIASSDPRLVKKIVARGSWFVARKSLPLYSNRM